MEIVEAEDGEALLAGPHAHVARVVEAGELAEVQPRGEVADPGAHLAVAHHLPHSLGLGPSSLRVLIQRLDLDQVVGVEHALAARVLRRHAVLGFYDIC